MAAPLEGTRSPAWVPGQLLPPANPPTFAVKLLWIYYCKLYRENMDLLSPTGKKSTRSHRGSCRTSSSNSHLEEPMKQLWGLPVEPTLHYSSSCTIDLLLSRWKRPATKPFPGNQPN